MKVLLINKYHYLKGGVERSYFDTAKILADHGHKLAFFSTKHPKNRPSRWSKYFVDGIDYDDEISLGQKIKAVANILYNFQANKNLEKLILEFKPDIAHLHGIYHQLSPSIINVLKKHDIPVVMTLHDYKLICPNYNLFVRGKIWERSRKHKYYMAFFDKAVKDSYLKSLVCALEAYLHKLLGLYEKIDLFISPSQFLIDKFKEFGFKKKIVLLRPALIIEDKYTEKAAATEKEKYILYFGRLSQEKGVDELINSYALLKTDCRLKIAGAGSEMASLKKLALDKGLADKIIFCGHKDGAELIDLIKSAEFIVMASRWQENCPYSVLEAKYFGKTVIVPRLGGLPEIIDNKTDYLYESGDIKSLAEIMLGLLTNSEKSANLKRLSDKMNMEQYNPEIHYKFLIYIYQMLLKGA